MTTKYIQDVLAITACTAVAVLTFNSCKAGAVKANELQIEKLKRIDMQLDNLKIQFNSAVQPIVAERNSILTPLCDKNGIPMQSCQIDYATGEVKDASKKDDKTKGSSTSTGQAK